MPAIHEPMTQAVGQAASAATHPEEIRAKVKLRLGRRNRLNATLCTTPAGLVSVGIMTAAIFLSIAALVRAARRRY
jgi:tetrahydromethanopterin S-methyltransferase subunit F